MDNSCNKIPFKIFCRVCEDISNAKTEKKILVLEKFFGKCRESIKKSNHYVCQLILIKIVLYTLYNNIKMFRKIQFIQYCDCFFQQ